MAARNRSWFCWAIGALVLLTLAADSQAQKPGFNYDEAKVPPYTLPDPLIMQDGTKVADADAWVKQRRPEILKLFEEHVYGRMPGELKARVVATEVEPKALDGLAVRKQVTLAVGDAPHEVRMDLLIYLPADAKAPVPLFMGMNFQGNQSIHSDPGIKISSSWIRDKPEAGISGNRASEDSRGKASRRWPVEMVLKRGYGLATMCYGDVDPDRNDFTDGVHPLLYKPGQTRPAADEWGAIGAWAWGLSSAMDYFETDPAIDAKRVAVHGHSRLGKTSLWAGARDERFAIVISNDSGCGGAALSRRPFGETIASINKAFPHWFCENFRKYSRNEDALPVDQHMLIALIAPRPVYVASASKDLWADPKGEFLAAKHAEPVYRLFGREGLPLEEFPEPDNGGAGTIGYHLRPGAHDQIAYDWERFLDFADKHFQTPAK